MYLFMNRKVLHVRAFKKIIVFCFFILSIFAVMYPDFLTGIAMLVKVGRGADLLFYLFILFATFLFVDIYIKNMDAERKVSMLVRKIALMEKDIEESKHNNNK